MKVLILGLGCTGRALADYFEGQNIEYDFAKKDDVNAKTFNENYINNLLNDVDLVVSSPGISCNNELIFQIKRRRIAFFGELEFATSKINNDIIAVTGTNGKTTTVSLINYLLKDYKGGCFCGGNIGVPVVSFLNKIKGGEIFVLETSSFQLETVENFKPHIAVILNITEDHLNRHGTMKEYIRCKYNIANNLDKNDYLLLNADDEYLQKHPPKTKAKIYYFSTKQKVLGSYIKNNSIYFNDNNKEIRLLSLSNTKLKGEHNLSNILAGALAVFLETRNVELLKGITSFSGVEHRIEFVKTINGVEFYNDSKATNIASTLVAVSSFKNDINLILGGSDKGYGFDELFKKLPRNVKNIAIFGEARYKIAFSANKYKFENIYLCDNLVSATKLLFKLSKPQSVVLLSPACASFDFFSGYAERGNFFKKVVRELECDETSFFENDQTNET